MVEKKDFDEVREKYAEDSQLCCSSGSDGGDCCASGSAGAGKSWKTVIFVAVILLAGAVAARSLLTRNSEKAPTSEGVALPIDTIKSSAESPATTEQPAKKAAVVCGVNLDSIESLSRIASEQKANVAFIFLAGDNEELARTASAQIEATVNMLSAKGKPVAAFTLQEDAGGYGQLVQVFAVKTFPCVIVTGRGCGAEAVSGEITATKLLSAFVKASTPISSCGPGSGPSCCPPRPTK